MDKLEKKKLLDYLQKQVNYWSEYIDMHPNDKFNDVNEGLIGGYHSVEEAILTGYFDVDKRKKKLCFDISFDLRKWVFGFRKWRRSVDIYIGCIELSWWIERKREDIDWMNV